MNNEWESRVRAEWDLYDNGRFGHLEGTIQIVEELLASERTNWLRSEIEKLEGEMKEVKILSSNSRIGVIEGHVVDFGSLAHNLALTSIITRYKEELKVLESESV